MKTPVKPTGLLLTVLMAAACSSAPQPATDAAPQQSADTDQLEALYRARADSAMRRFTYSDVSFMTGMIGHHAQALVLARLSPTHGASPAIQTLSARIINAQQDEIATMQQWLRDRRQPVPEIVIAGTSLMVYGPSYAVHMPGMLTPGQIERLDNARGPEFDRLFLTFMIQHHKGAVTMVENLFRTDGAAQDEAVFKIASDIQVDQRTEIARMELMLEELPEPGSM